MPKPTPLKRAIFDSGMRQKDIAARAGIDEATMSRIVNGLHTSDANWRKLAKTLGKTADEIRHPDGSAQVAA